MFLYDSLRSYARSLQHPNRFISLNNYHDCEESHRPARTNYKNTMHYAEWDEKSGLQVESWMDSCDTVRDRRAPENRNFFQSHFDVHRLPLICRRKSLTRKLKKRLAAATFCANQRHSAKSAIQSTCPAEPTSCAPRESDLGQNGSSHAKCGLDMNVYTGKNQTYTKPDHERSRPRDPNTYSWSSSEMTAIDETEVRAAYQRKKPRQVTRYYSTNDAYRRKRVAVQIHSPEISETRRGSGEAQREGERRKAPLGSYLEWLKFLA